MKKRESARFFAIFLIIFLSPLFLIAIKVNQNNQEKEKASMNILGDLTQKKQLIRKPAVAGSFYPAEKEALDAELEKYLSLAKKKTIDGKWKIFFAPHAGIVYSGRTSAWAFKQIEESDISKVILIGSSHREFFDHAAVYDKGTWQTPLGNVEIDAELALKILDKEKGIISDTDSHEEDHVLELELIFLQKTLKNFSVVPILVSKASDELIKNLAKKISQNLDQQTILVVSTDLSHYPSYETAKIVDEKTVNAIISGKTEEFEKIVRENESANYPGLETCICGFEAVRVALKTAEILGIKNFEKLKYENSGDVSGDRERVVGYGAISAWRQNIHGTKDKNSPYLDDKSQKEAISIARKTLQEFFSGGKIPDIVPQNSMLKKPMGAFVTLRKKKVLRGCIGKFDPVDPLYQVIQSMTISAATKDRRFLPVKKEELQDIDIEISVMTPKKKVENWEKIEIGRHGVTIQKGEKSGTFLPQVAKETGWSKEEFLSQLCSQKAGLSKDCYKDPDVFLYTFEAQVFEEK